MEQKRHTKKKIVAGILTVLALIVIAFVAGRLIFTGSQAHAPYEQDTSNVVVIQGGYQGAASSTNLSASGGDADAAPADAEIADCADALKKDTETNKTEYQKNTILVRFAAGVTYDDAKNLLKIYKLAPDNDADAQLNYPTNNHVITVAVPAGKEFTEICTVKRDSNVKFSGLNTIFSLHE